MVKIKKSSGNEVAQKATKKKKNKRSQRRSSSSSSSRCSRSSCKCNRRVKTKKSSSHEVAQKAIKKKTNRRSMRRASSSSSSSSSSCSSSRSSSVSSLSSTTRSSSRSNSRSSSKSSSTSSENSSSSQHDHKRPKRRIKKKSPVKKGKKRIRKQTHPKKYQRIRKISVKEKYKNSSKSKNTPPLEQPTVSKPRSVSRSPRGKRRSRSPTPRPITIHIGRVLPSIHEGHIREIFGQYGIIKNVEFPEHEHSYSQQCAHVEYTTADEAEKAMKWMNGGQIGGQQIIVELVPILKPTQPICNRPLPVRQTASRLPSVHSPVRNPVCRRSSTYHSRARCRRSHSYSNSSS